MRFQLPKPVLLVVLLTLFFALALGSLAVSHEPHDTQLAIWTVIIALAVFLAESIPIHILYRREATSFSLLEVPVIVGVVVLPGWKLLLAVVCGAGLALTLVRRQPFMKVIFNVPNLALHASATTLLFDALSGDPGLGPRTVAAALIAGLGGSVLASSMIGLIIRASEGSLDPRKTLNMLGFSAIVGVTNATLAVIALKLAAVEVWSVGLLAVPLLMAMGAYRAFVSERHHREQLQFLLSATKSLSADLGEFEAIVDLLNETADMFRASRVELFIFESADAVDTPVRASLTKDGTSIVELDANAIDALRILVRDLSTPQLVAVERPKTQLEKWLRDLDIDEALVQSLQSEDGDIGLFVVGDRVGAASSFGQADLELFSTLGFQIGTALENDRLAQALTQLQELEGELSYQAVHDPLTSLPNRLGLRRHLEELAEDSAFDLLFIDLDDFKLVNDTLGHATGDQLLVEVSNRIRDSLGTTGFAARLGGDEFAVCVGFQSGNRTGKAIVASLSRPIRLDAATVTVGCSIGIASSDECVDVPAMLRRADVAMYAAKSAGKNRVELYTDQLGVEIEERQRLLSDLRRAIDHGDLKVHYQPIFALTANGSEHAGSEALVRWATGDGVRSAGSFLGVAEESGLVTVIDRLVYELAMDDYKRLDQGSWISINLSAKHLQEDDVVSWILSTTTDAGVDPSNVILEVTETAVMTNVEASIERLGHLRAAGFGVALDDFGTGYSSIAYLSRLPISIVKIAGSFVRDLPTIEGRTIVRAMIDLAHTLGLPTVAEGVETEEQLAMLQEMGCDLAQGYLLGYPVDVAQSAGIEELI